MIVSATDYVYLGLNLAFGLTENLYKKTMNYTQSNTKKGYYIFMMLLTFACVILWVIKTGMEINQNDWLEALFSIMIVVLFSDYMVAYKKKAFSKPVQPNYTTTPNDIEVNYEIVKAE